MAETLLKEEPAEPILEPTRDRIHVYDLIRGVAILGILLANIPWFAQPLIQEGQSFHSSLYGVDAAVAAWTTALVAGKFRSMLAVLFGIGMWLQYERRSKIPGNWPRGYLKRMAILALFGAADAILIWDGDILFYYSVAALATFWLTPKPERVLRRVVASSGILAVLASMSLVGLGIWASMPGVTLSGTLGEEFSKEAELKLFHQGSYLDQVAFRAERFPEDSIAGTIVFLPFLAGLIMLGVLLARHRVLETPSLHPKARRIMLRIGFGIGLPLCLLVGIFSTPSTAFFFSLAVEFCFGALTSMGLIMLLAIWAESRKGAGVRAALARVGRTAFSNYILQSLLCTAIFYSWGFGLFGKLNRLEILAVVPVVWACNLVFSHLWLNRYRFGPLEWLWRSWTEGQRLPMRTEIPPLP